MRVRVIDQQEKCPLPLPHRALTSVISQNHEVSCLSKRCGSVFMAIHERERLMKTPHIFWTFVARWVRGSVLTTNRSPRGEMWLNHYSLTVHWNVRAAESAYGLEMHVAEYGNTIQLHFRYIHHAQFVMIPSTHVPRYCTLVLSFEGYYPYVIMVKSILCQQNFYTLTKQSLHLCVQIFVNNVVYMQTTTRHSCNTL